MIPIHYSNVDRTLKILFLHTIYVEAVDANCVSPSDNSDEGHCCLYRLQRYPPFHLTIVSILVL